MPILSEKERVALDLLKSDKSLSYDDLDDIFKAFGFDDEFEVPNRTWYFHSVYACGHFRAEPRHDFSVLSVDQRMIVWQMIQTLIDKRELEADNA